MMCKPYTLLSSGNYQDASKPRSAKRKVFYSFHYANDCWRVSQVRNMGVIEGNQQVKDNDWESIKGCVSRIENWVNSQLEGKSCCVVLVGEKTAERNLVNYEIVQSWNKGKGVVGVHIYGLKDKYRQTSTKGQNPFEDIAMLNQKGSLRAFGRKQTVQGTYYRTVNSKLKMSDIVKCYDPQGTNSQQKYDWINTHLLSVVEEAIKIRNESKILLV